MGETIKVKEIKTGEEKHYAYPKNKEKARDLILSLLDAGYFEIVGVFKDGDNNNQVRTFDEEQKRLKDVRTTRENNLEKEPTLNAITCIKPFNYKTNEGEERTAQVGEDYALSEEEKEKAVNEGNAKWKEWPKLAYDNEIKMEDKLKELWEEHKASGKIETQLKDIAKLEPLDQEDALNEMAKKYNKSKGVLKKQIENNKKKEAENNKKPKVSMSEKVRFLLEQEKPNFKSLGIGVHRNPETGEDYLYFGTKIYDGLYGVDGIVTSEGRILIAQPDNNEIKREGIHYRYPFFDDAIDYTWSNCSSPYSIKEFLFGERKNVSLKECYEDTLKNNKEFLDHPEPIVHTSIACSILSSYFLPIFEAMGRDFFNAEKGSGKTRQSTLYDLQMFNPLMSADMSPASYYRVIESTNASLIIDDFDAIGNEDKKLATIQIMRTGYKKGQKAVRTLDDKAKTPGSFSVYNKMIINNVGGLDEITSDRCNTYQLIKSTNKKIQDKKLDDKNPIWLLQRDKKFYASLLHWEKVRSTYETLEIEGVSGRDLEKIAPILTIGKLVLDEKKFEELVLFEKRRLEELKDRDVSEDWLFLALQLLVRKMKNASDNEKEHGFDMRLDSLVKDLAANILDPNARDFNSKKRGLSIYLGKVFKGHSALFKSGKVHGGFVKYNIKPASLLKLIQIRDYESYFEKDELDSMSSLSNPTNHTNPTNLSNQSIQNIEKEDFLGKKEDFYRKSGEIGEIGEIEGRGGSPVFNKDLEKENKEILEDFS